MNTNSIIQILISAAVAGFMAPAEAFLQNIHDKDVNEYNALIYTAYFGLTKAGQAAAGTSNQLDDQGVQAAYTILSSSASKNGITLAPIVITPEA